MHHVNPFWFGAGGGGPTDPYFANVVGLWHFDETAGSTTYVDKSNLANNMVDVTGTQTSAAQSVFGGLSLRTGNAGSDHAATAINTAGYTLGLGDFTVEFRYRPDALATANIFDMRGGVDGPRLCLYTYADGRLVVYVNTTEQLVAVAGSVTATAWNAIAYDRVNVASVYTGRLYVNGVVVGSWTDNIDYDNSSALQIVVPSSQATADNVYHDEMRITKGTARYQGAYTPAVAAFPDS